MVKNGQKWSKWGETHSDWAPTTLMTVPAFSSERTPLQTPEGEEGRSVVALFMVRFPR